MDRAVRKDGWLTAGLISAGVTGLAALMLAMFLIVSVGGGPEFFGALMVILVVVPVPWLCLFLLGQVRDAETELGAVAPPRWHGWGLVLLAGGIWLAVNGMVLWVVRNGLAAHPSRDIDWGDIGHVAVFALVPLPALIALGNFCLRGRPVPPGGDIYDATA